MGTNEGARDESGHGLFVPGRLCVLGEHTDWAAGYRSQNRAIPPGFTLVATTREGLHARVKPRADGRLVFKAARFSRTCSSRDNSSSSSSSSSIATSPEKGNGAEIGPYPPSDDMVQPLDVAMTEEALKGVIEARGFFMYVAGTALVVCSRFGLFSQPCSRPSSSGEGGPLTEGASQVNGVTIDNYLTTLPLKKGLSSSAAVCVLVVRALSLAYGLELSVPQVMELAHLGEARCGSKCGRMDQCCALGPNHVAAMFFDGEDVKIYEVRPPECGIFLVVADLNGSKDTIKMLAALNRGFPFAKDDAEERVHQYMRDNTELAWKAVCAIEQGDAQELGHAMGAAQENFDECAVPICPSEFSSPLLHKVMSDDRVKALSWGIKGVGAQGDGSVQVLAKGRQEQEELTRVLKEMGMGCVLPLTVIRSTTSSDSSDKKVDNLGAGTSTAAGPDIRKGPQGPLVEMNGTAAPSGQECGGRITSGSAGGSGGSGGELTNGDKGNPTRTQVSPGLPPRMLSPRRVKSAVLVAAGLSTRMFPASAVVKKELFPIVDHDGVCKPVILAIMEGLVESGIERFVVIVQEKDIPLFSDFFSMKAVEKHKHRLKPPQRAYCARIEALRSRITYAVQEHQEGFGHAVFCARDALLGKSDSGGGGGGGGGRNECTDGAMGSGAGDEDEPFLLVLGDHLYRRGAGTTQACASQLVHAFLDHGESGKPAIGLKVMSESAVSPYGVASGRCVAYPSPHIVERWHKAAATPARTPANGQAFSGKTPDAVSATTSTVEGTAAAEGPSLGAKCNGTPRHELNAAVPGGGTQDRLPLGGRVYRLDKLVEKPTAEFARENLVTPDLERGDDGEGRHLVVFGQYILPSRRTFDIFAEDIKLDRRERGEFQLTSVLDRMRQEDGGMLGCVIHGDALDMGIPSPYVETMGAFAKPHCCA